MSYILDDIEKFNIFKISRLRALGIKGLHKILDNDIEKFIKNIEKNNITFPTDDSFKSELYELDKINAKIITYKDDLYPELLKSIDSFPLVLTCIGNTDLLNNKRKISIIGSRSCSINNFNFCKKIAREISNYGYTVVSGLARGIDSSAHIGSIDNGTIAVLGSGIDKIYPKENEFLYYDIIKNNGLIITEFQLGTPPKAENFPIRNRIIAGLSSGIVVMGAGKNSGTMHTINQAIKYDREVMIFPGSPYDERFFGSNKLLQDGATMVLNTEDIIESLESLIKNFSLKDNIFSDFSCNNIKDDNLSIDDLILSKLDYTPLEINELIDSLSKYDLNTINSSIIKLQLEDKIILDFGKITLKVQ